MRLLVEDSFFLRWKGGENYLKNVLFGIQDLPIKVSRLKNGSENKLQIPTEFSFEYPKRGSISHILNRMGSKKGWLNSNPWIEQIDVALQISDSNLTSLIPSIRWIPDFQHIDLPEFFSEKEIESRNSDFKHFAINSTKIILSSNHAKSKFDELFEFASEKSVAIPFSVSIPDEIWGISKSDIMEKYSLDENWIHFPSQWWKHKNHECIIESFRKVQSEITLVISGKMDDYRNPEHKESILKLVAKNSNSKRIRVLGEIPYPEMLAMMRFSKGLLNPSYYEGWSTTVEEAKSFGIPILASDIDVHKEQLQSYSFSSKLIDPEDRDLWAKEIDELGDQKVAIANEHHIKSRVQTNCEKFGADFFKVLEDAIKMGS